MLYSVPIEGEPNPVCVIGRVAAVCPQLGHKPTLATLEPGAGPRSPGALTCAKPGRFVQGDASELSGRKMKSYPAFARRSTRH